MTANHVKIAVLGGGLIGKRHIEAIGRSQRANLCCIVDPHPEVQAHAGKLGVQWFSSIADMQSAIRPDGVIIATPNQMHVANALECIRAKLPVLIEKPIADVSHSAASLVEEANKAGIPVLVGHHRRHNPLIKTAKAKLSAGRIGKIVSVNANCWLYKPDDYFDVDWRTKKGAGPIFINLIHDIDLLQHLVGEITTITAFESSQIRGNEVEDTAAILLRFENGALGTVSVTDTAVAPWSWELCASENPAYPATGQACYQIGGTEGSIEIPTNRIWFQKGKKSWWEPIENERIETEKADPIDLQIEHFCDVISRKTDPLVSGEEGLRSLRVIEAIKHSAQSGKSVNISDFSEII